MVQVADIITVSSCGMQSPIPQDGNPSLIPQSQHVQPPPPLWAYLILIVAVLAMSTGGMWFALLVDTPPLMQACWRLSLTSFLQIFGFLYELKYDESLDRAFWSRFRLAIPLMLIIGTSLGVHFGSWGWSVAHTSLLNSLLLVSATPLLLVLLMTFRWLFTLLERHQMPPEHYDRLIEPSPHLSSSSSLFRIICCPFHSLPPTLFEVMGSLMGFLGVFVLLIGSSNSSAATEGHAPTLAGNLAALLGAGSMLVYLEGGAILRSWMPLFVYALPVTATAALVLGVVSLAIEHETSCVGLGPASLFGFLGSWDRFGLVFGAAAVSGIAGHTFANLALKHLSPLLISVAVLWEPLVGSVIGWLVNVQGPPDVSAIAATPLLLIGALVVTLGGRNTGGEWKTYLRRVSLLLCCHYKPAGPG